MLTPAALARIDSQLERWLGLDARLAVSPASPAMRVGAECHQYCPSSLLETWWVLRRLRIGAGEVFVDYGCGTGHVLAIASRFPFQRLIGVEASAALVDLARRNLRQPSLRQPGRLDILNQDARRFQLPADASVLYFFNPFRGSVLRSVLDEVEASLRRHPRRLRIVFNTPRHLAGLQADYPWLSEVGSCRLCNLIVVYAAELREAPEIAQHRAAPLLRARG